MNLKSEQVIFWKIFEHPFTRLIIGCTTKGCCLIEFFERRYLNDIFERLQTLYQVSIVYDVKNPILQQIETELKLYFTKQLESFSFPLDIRGSNFQIKVWGELLKIPYGETRTYQEIALKLGDGSLARKVGSANGANHIAIVIPCHRVIGKDGHLTGYGGGMNKKTKLLKLENDKLMLKGNVIITANKPKMTQKLDL